MNELIDMTRDEIVKAIQQEDLKTDLKIFEECIGRPATLLESEIIKDYIMEREEKENGKNN